MYFYPYSVLDFERGDVNGDRIPDNVYLIGKRTPNAAFVEDITLVIQDGLTGRITRIQPKNNAGYNPTIFLGDFTGNGVDDILVSIDSGGSGGYAFYYIYSFKNNRPIKIFDHEKFDEKYKYTVNFKDNYEVEVVNLNDDIKYIIDIRYKGEEYLSEIYDDNGKLIKPIEGWVNPLGSLYPIDVQRDGVYELYAQQRIAGRYNADNLGYIQTSLKWNDSELEFTPFFQTLGILG